MNISQLTSLIIILKTCGQIIMVMSNWEKIGFAVYSIPAIGGSSGSPIVNEDGELIGMIHSVHVNFPFISFSPRTEDLYNFLEDVIK